MLIRRAGDCPLDKEGRLSELFCLGFYLDIGLLSVYFFVPLLFDFVLLDLISSVVSKDIG